MGAAISNTHKEIYKAARQCLTDRVMAVRCAASKVSDFHVWKVFTEGSELIYIEPNIFFPSSLVFAGND